MIIHIPSIPMDRKILRLILSARKPLHQAESAFNVVYNNVQCFASWLSNCKIESTADMSHAINMLYP